MVTYWRKATGFQPSRHRQFCNFKCLCSIVMYNSEFHILQWETNFAWLRSSNRAQHTVLASQSAITWATASSSIAIICKRWVRGLQSEYRFSGVSSQGELASQLPLLSPVLLIPHHQVLESFTLPGQEGNTFLFLTLGLGLYFMLNHYSLIFLSSHESRDWGLGLPTLSSQCQTAELHWPGEFLFLSQEWEFVCSGFQSSQEEAHIQLCTLVV